MKSGLPDESNGISTPGQGRPGTALSQEHQSPALEQGRQCCTVNINDSKKVASVNHTPTVRHAPHSLTARALYRAVSRLQDRKEAREMAQLVRCLSHKHGAPSSIPRTHGRKQSVVAQVRESGGWQSPAALWPVSFTSAESPHNNKRLKHQGGYSSG